MSKIKEEKGLGLIGTIFLIAIIVAIVVLAVKFIKIGKYNQKLADIKTDMLLLQGKVKVISGDYTLNKKDEVLAGTPIKKMEQDEIINTFLEKKVIDTKEKNSKFYVIKQEDLEAMELKQVALPENTYYVVNYKDNEVYITSGFEYTDGTTYYSLTEINKLQNEEIKQKVNEENKGEIKEENKKENKQKNEEESKKENKTENKK